MIDQYSGLLQSAQYNARKRRVEVKSNLWDDDRLWTPSNASTAQEDQTTTYYRAVPWLMRSIEMRANAVASVPFRILRGETEVDRSDAWRNVVGGLPNPYRLLWLLEAGLCFGPAYLWREQNRVTTTGLRYIVASTIEPQLDEVQGLTAFIRNLGVKRITVPPETLLYFWKPDPHVELGPPLVNPVAAALAASGVLYNLDQFTAAFWGRGAIKATLLTVEGAPSEDAKNELKKWWERVVAGINNAFSGRVISAAVKPVVIGEGLDSLQNNDLTNKQREDICTAFGIPFSVMNSTAAGGLGGGGVVSQDEMHFYDKTIRPECNFIAGVLNEQWLAPQGYRFEFLLDGLDVFQEDENQRAASFKVYVDAGLPLEVAGTMLGIELPDGWTWERIAKEKEERAAQVAAQMQPAPGQEEAEDEEEDDEEDDQPAPNMRAVLDDLRKWRAKSQKRGKLADFESDVIPHHVTDTVKLIGFDWLANFQALKAKVEPNRDAEEALRKQITKLFQDQRSSIAAQIEAGETVDWATVERELSSRLTPQLVKIATDQAIAEAMAAGLGFDPAAVNLAAWKWASAYSYELIKGITATTREIVANATAQFISTPGMTIGDLTTMLDSAFGPVRAQMIAVTETTRAYSQATSITQEMLKEMGVNVARVWQTSNDERICDICNFLDGQTEDDWSGDYPDGPPAHPNCRCWATTKVIR